MTSNFWLAHRVEASPSQKMVAECAQAVPTVAFLQRPITQRPITELGKRPFVNEDRLPRSSKTVEPISAKNREYFQ
ncbi:MAG: hypothetical protein BRC47_09190 [Cyanobacteria bacterium QS_7_48_42]|nr:MAG: hypothetical protein BRC37_01230 [Cyanobacteria bacterium QH_3_48_40]PSP01651.1 MAG: hypothetical protein BRC47_09190 [Cyanobacteria bacterium QS_7_48_42]